MYVKYSMQCDIYNLYNYVIYVYMILLPRSGCSKLSNRIIRNFTLRPRFLDNNAESLGVMQLLLIKPDQEENFIFDVSLYICKHYYIISILYNV